MSIAGECNGKRFQTLGEDIGCVKYLVHLMENKLNSRNPRREDQIPAHTGKPEEDSAGGSGEDSARDAGEAGQGKSMIGECQETLGGYIHLIGVSWERYD